MNRSLFLLAPLVALVSVGCGGGSKNTAPLPASSIVYTNPTAAPSEWKLVKDATSTSTHLVLNLVGPSDGSKYRGIGFTLQADPTLVKFVQFKDEAGQNVGYYKDGGIFLDKDPVGGDMPVVLQTGGVSTDKLMVGIYQRTDEQLFGALNGATAKDCNQVLLQVAVDLDKKLEAMPGAVPLTVIKARAIGDSINSLLNRKLLDVKLNVGKLELK